MFEELFGLKKPFFGIDIGISSIKIVQVKKTLGKIGIFGYNEINLENKFWAKNGIQNADTIKPLILNALKNSSPKPITAKWAVSALPESLVFSKVIELPTMKNHEISSALFHKLGDFIPISPNDVYFDWQILETKNKKISCLIIAVTKTLVDSYLKMFKEIGIELVALETKPLAVSRAITDSSRQDGLVIIDIGAENTSISIINNGVFTTAGSIAIGAGDHFENLNDTQIKTLSNEITMLISFYNNRINPDIKITKAKLCGGGANTPGICAAITKNTGLKTEIGNPLINIARKASKDLTLAKSLRFSTAIGLALRNINSNDKH